MIRNVSASPWVLLMHFALLLTSRPIGLRMKYRKESYIRISYYTFVKAICEELGVEDVITSPSFALVNEYTAGDGSPVYHFDFYRIKKLDEVYDMGYEDYFYSGNLCFLEWPELIADLLPEDCTKVTITVEEDGTRSVEW